MNLITFFAILFFLIWMILLFVHPDTRREQLIMSGLGVFLAPAMLLFIVTENSQPLLGVVDHLSPLNLDAIIFISAFFGISSVLYEVIIGKHAHRLRGNRIIFPHPAIHWLIKLSFVVGVWIFLGSVLVASFGMVLIKGFAVAGLMIGTYIIADRKDLLLNALMTGVLLALLLIFTESVIGAIIFQTPTFFAFQPEDFTGFTARQIVWPAVVGFAIGPLYEYVRRLRV